MNKVPVLSIQPFNSELNESEIYVNDFRSHLIKNKDVILKPHKHDFFLTIIFTRGTGKHTIDFNSYPVQTGSVFMLRPGQSHNWELSDDIDGFVFFHSPTFYSLFNQGVEILSFPFFYSSYNAPNAKLSSSEMSVIRPLFELLLKEFKSDQLLRQQKIGGLIKLIYIELTRSYIKQHTHSSENPPMYLKKLNEFEQLIDKYFIQEKSVTVYANWLNISRKHLNRITNLMLGKTATQVISDRVILEAKRLIVENNESLKEIGFHLGYSDYAYFSRVFKTQTGLNPKEFRFKYHKS
ncbi:MAG: helix-turn-helix transcriptional regulator [Crocinitomicaceae bacterium]|nr:helix-turn-helix transcriptional regulator [Crocinitomicaceae bacterium]